MITPSGLSARTGRHSSKPLFSLQWQITAAVALGLIALFGAFAAIAYSTINQSTHAALNERQAIAALSAEAIDNLIYHVTDQMESAATLEVLQYGEPEEVKALLQTLRSTMATVENLSLVDLGTGETWTVGDAESTQAKGLLLTLQSVFINDIRETQVFQSFPTHLDSGHPALAIVAAPVISANSTDQRVLVGEVHLRQGDRGLVPLPQFSSTSGTAIIDGDGNVLAFSNGNMKVMTLEHSDILADVRFGTEAVVVIHDPPEGKSHVVAFAPFQTISGGVVVEEREDLVLAVPQQLRRNLILYGFLGLALTSLLAWFHAWRTMRPIRRLTIAARSIADGVLDQPLRIYRNDEIGVLAQSFEVMRQQLLEAEGQRIQWDQEMETRVTERTEQVHTLLASVISAQEEERKRVARELHDQIAQDLATMVITLQRLVQSPVGMQEEDRTSLEHVQKHLGKTLQEMRRMISDLRPSALDDLGLEAAVRDYVESRVEGTGLRVQFEAVGAAASMDDSTQTALFRILQEAISNVVRHAEAQHLKVTLALSDDEAEATVEDDGKGFEVSSIAQTRDAPKFGILGMQERAALLRGTVEVRSQPGHGSIVRVWIPLSG